MDFLVATTAMAVCPGSFDVNFHNFGLLADVSGGKGAGLVAFNLNGMRPGIARHKLCVKPEQALI